MTAAVIILLLLFICIPVLITANKTVYPYAMGPPDTPPPPAQRTHVRCPRCGYMTRLSMEQRRGITRMLQSDEEDGGVMVGCAWCEAWLVIER